MTVCIGMYANFHDGLGRHVTPFGDNMVCMHVYLGTGLDKGKTIELQNITIVSAAYALRPAHPQHH